MNADGSEERLPTQRGHDSRWSRDGEKISFVTNREGDDEIYVINAGGSGRECRRSGENGASRTAGGEGLCVELPCVQVGKDSRGLERVA